MPTCPLLWPDSRRCGGRALAARAPTFACQDGYASGGHPQLQDPGQGIAFGAYTVGFNTTTGSINQLVAQGISWADANHQLGVFEYKAGQSPCLLGLVAPVAGIHGFFLLVRQGSRHGRVHHLFQQLPAARGRANPLVCAFGQSCKGRWGAAPHRGIIKL
jgi:hypothetical protein